MKISASPSNNHLSLSKFTPKQALHFDHHQIITLDYQKSHQKQALHSVKTSYSLFYQHKTPSIREGRQGLQCLQEGNKIYHFSFLNLTISVAYLLHIRSNGVCQRQSSMLSHIRTNGVSTAAAYQDQGWRINIFHISINGVITTTTYQSSLACKSFPHQSQWCLYNSSIYKVSSYILCKRIST